MPTPILNPKQYFVDPMIGRAESLPADAFTSVQFLELELATIFNNHWLPLPLRACSELRQDSRSLGDLLALRGNRFPLRLLNRPIFLQRDWHGIVRAFPNVCTHAWYPLVHGHERDKTIVCGQHGRKFDCEGKFISQAGFNQKMENFPRECDHLQAMPVEEFSKLFFTAFSKPSQTLPERVEPISKLTNQLPWDCLHRVPQPGEERVVSGNWKQHVWNYMDHFHVGYIHRAPHGLADAVEMSSYQTELHKTFALQWVYARDPAHGFAADLLPKRFIDPSAPNKRVFALWFYLFPNLTLNFYPWGLSINIYNPIPKTPDKTLFQWYHFSWDDDLYAQRDALWHNNSVDQEDVDALHQVNSSIQSGHPPRGRFSPTQELGGHWFHRLVYESIWPNQTKP